MASVKEDILTALSAGRTKGEAEAIFKDVTSALSASLVSEDDSVRFQGFGTLKVVKRAARTARNPATGASVQVAEKLVIKFTQAQKSA